MQPDSEDRKYKEFLKMRKRMEDIRKILNKIPLVPLPEPIRKGWVVTIRLRDDIARRKDAAEILQLIDIGYQKEYITQSEKEVKIIRTGKKSYSYTKDKKRVTKDLVPQRKRIDQKTFDTLTEKQKTYFDYDPTDHAFKKYGRKYYSLYIPDFWMTLKVRPNYVTHFRKRGGALEKEYEFLHDKVDLYWLTATGGYRKSYPKGKDRTKTRAEIRKVIKGESDDIAVERVPLEYKY